MPWYTATVIVECTLADGTAPSFVDEQLRLIQAADAAQAYEAALAIGKAEEHSYENPYGSMVQWRFCGLAELAELLDDTLGTGTELSSVRRHAVSGPSLVLPKEKLCVFWHEAVQDTPIGELLSEHDLSYMPASFDPPPKIDA